MAVSRTTSRTTWLNDFKLLSRGKELPDQIKMSSQSLTIAQKTLLRRTGLNRRVTRLVTDLMLELNARDVSHDVADVVLESDVSDLKIEKADLSNVYTKNEVDIGLALKADETDVYTKESVDSKLSLKSDLSNTYTKSQVDALIPSISQYVASIAFTINGVASGSYNVVGIMIGNQVTLTVQIRDREFLTSHAIVSSAILAGFRPNVPVKGTSRWWATGLSWNTLWPVTLSDGGVLTIGDPSSPPAPDVYNIDVSITYQLFPVVPP